MLTNSILESMQDAAGLATFAPAAPAREVTSNHAVNANRYDQRAALVRRARRMRRAERSAVRANHGWTARLW